MTSLPTLFSPESAIRPERVYAPRAQRRNEERKRLLKADADRCAAARAARRIPVATELKDPHPLVAATARELETLAPDNLGLIETASPDSLQIHVTPLLARRTLLILDALIKEIEKRGWKVTPASDPFPRNLVTIGEEQVGFVISEIVESKAHTPTREELKQQKADPVFFVMPKRDRFASGRLYLGVQPCHHRRGHWSDGTRWAVEDCLDLCLEALQKSAEAAPKLREQAQQYEAQRQEEERQRQEREKLRKEEERKQRELKEAEEAKKEKLLDHLDRLQLADRAREYADRLDRTIVGESATADQVAWIKWVRSYADQIDPCRSGTGTPTVRSNQVAPPIQQKTPTTGAGAKENASVDWD